jgi:hypothetical protein
MFLLGGLEETMSAYGQLGIVTSPHPLATKAGAKVLRSGGNAIESAIAIGATIGVVYPHFCGLGGDAVGSSPTAKGGAPPSTVSAKRRRRFLPSMARSRHVAPSPSSRPPARSTPGGMRWNGRRGNGEAAPPSRLFSPMLSLTPETAFRCRSRKRSGSPFAAMKLRVGRGFAPAFMPDGPPEVGSLLRQDGVAQTLQAIAAAGPRSFYDGELAKTLAVRG